MAFTDALLSRLPLRQLVFLLVVLHKNSHARPKT